MHTVEIKVIGKPIVYKSKHKDLPIERAVRKQYGETCRFVQTHGLPKGYGAILNHSRYCNHVATVCISVEDK